MNATSTCFYCKTVYRIEHGHVCEEAERCMQAKRHAEITAKIGARNARRLARKATRKAVAS